jgi:glucose/mannose-6-phosphate isomerase
MSEMLDMIRTLGDQLRWASGLEPLDLSPHDSVLLAGMGGSGVAGDYLASVAAETDGIVHVHKTYAPLPEWARRARPLVVCASYSGNTEETLDSFNEAVSLGLETVVMSTGGQLLELASEHGVPAVTIPAGLQPRAAVGFMAGAALHLGALAGVVPSQQGPLLEAAEIADAAVVEGSRAWMQADVIATDLLQRITIIYGGGPVSATVAGRWKTQINENAKMPAWWSFLPELDHNEIVGWETLPDVTTATVGIVALADRDDHPRVAARRRFTEQLTQEAVPWVATVESIGESRLARLMSLTVVGDLVSWMLADKSGVDPTLVATIEKLKALLKD